ncbi:MAG: putative Ig domain-containing protein [Myxococcota bacterium]
MGRAYRAWVVVAAGTLAGCPQGEEGAGGGQVTTSPTSDGTSTGTAESSSSTMDTLADATGGGTTAAPVVEIDCAQPPSGAVGADYAHAFALTPASSGASWTADGLPPGVTISPLSGTLSGAPEEAGTFEVTVAVDAADGIGEAVCSIEVAEAVGVDLSALARPCIGPEDALEDFVTGGDGSPLTCSTPSSNGAGARPEAVEVDARTCAITGEPTPDEYGTWVWITTVEQAGARTYVPYCVTQDTPPEGSFEITASLGDNPDALLEPFVGEFTPGEPVQFGGRADPHFEIVGGCGGACFYGFSFFVGASPFGGDCGQENCFSLAPSSVLTDDDGNAIGLQHDMVAYGPEVAANFEGRPFVLPWELTYCIADNGDDCEGNDNILANAGAHAHVSVLMLPQSSGGR